MVSWRASFVSSHGTARNIARDRLPGAMSVTVSFPSGKWPNGSRFEGAQPCRAARSRIEGLMARIALYPGSFDPVTNGHLDVVRHAVTLCDRLVVAIGVHPGKKPLFSTEQRLDMVDAIFAPVAAAAGCGFERTTYDGLTVT